MNPPAEARDHKVRRNDTDTIRLNHFPLLDAHDFKDCVENITGKGTVLALQVRPQHGKRGGTIVRIQFTYKIHAEDFHKFAEEEILENGSLFDKKVESDFLINFNEPDIISDPRILGYEMRATELHFGCQVSDDSFLVLWNKTDVDLKFALDLKEINLYFEYHGDDYWLQISSENVWRFVLYGALGVDLSKSLYIKLFGSPRLYKKHHLPAAVPTLDYFMIAQDENWVRITDFTESRIGLSSGLCIELPENMELPNFQRVYACYEERETSLNLENGQRLSCNLPLVVERPPERVVDLPYDILFKVCSLVQSGCLSWPTLKSSFYEFLDTENHKKSYIDHALEKLHHLEDCCYAPRNWLRKEYKKYKLEARQPVSPYVDMSVEDGLVYIRRVQVSPTKMYFSGPEVNMSNRVIRHYHEHVESFLRVTFVEEDLSPLHPSVLVDKETNQQTELYDRVLSVLRDGIQIGSKTFEFLAFSTSQLRECSLWMFASSERLSAGDIRRWMGNFGQIKNVAKYAARLGQSYSSSKRAPSVGVEEIESIDDVTNGTGFIFSDGIGKVSAAFAEEIAKECKIDDKPSAYQIRYAGYKGVVAVDPTSNVKLSLRPSMLKYESLNTELDVLGWSKYIPCFLNRQIITLLSTLGVKDDAFERRQREAIATIDAMLENPLRADEALEYMAPGGSATIVRGMLESGFDPNEELFLKMMMQTYRASVLLDLKTKTRIFIPKGRQMMGCMDETRTLEYGQVFIQCSPRRYNLQGGSSSSGEKIIDDGGIIKGRKVVVAKNPCLHPGDVRVLEAIDVIELHHMKDCVVFPQKGLRPHPDECSGSDLDGDVYFVCWDPELIPPGTVEPMNYAPPPAEQVDGDVTIEQVQKSFADHICSASLGVISNAHLANADIEMLKARSPKCLELAQLFSVAVDFPKTGVPATMQPWLYPRKYPDFMEKTEKKTYESGNVIGKLFREVKGKRPSSDSLPSLELGHCDPDMVIAGYVNYMDDAIVCKREYDYKLGNLMDFYGIKSEGELLGECILRGFSKAFDRKKESVEAGHAVNALRIETRKRFYEGIRGDQGREVTRAKASAWYRATYDSAYSEQPKMNRPYFISFPWCVYELLLSIKKDKRNRRG